MFSFLFLCKLNEINAVPKIFEIMKMAMPYAGRRLDDINIHSKLVAWSCYTIVNICVNCMPNILLLRGRNLEIRLEKHCKLLLVSMRNKILFLMKWKY